MSDLISRQAAIDAVSKGCQEWRGIFQMCEENIKAIEAEPNSCEYWDSESHFCALRRPQAEPIKHGKWINRQLPLPLSDDTKECVECNVCYTHWDVATKYCPNCGADMREVEE